jgi:hypothetical protein
MAVNTTNRIAGPFTGTGATTIFPFTFKVFNPGDLYVVQATPTVGDTAAVSTVLTLNTDYAVALNGDQDYFPGGTVSLRLPLSTGYRLTITSNVAVLQQVILMNLGGFFPDIINQALDKATILSQQLNLATSRSIKLDLTDDSIDPTLPPASARVGKALYFGNDGGINVADYPGIVAGGVTTLNPGDAPTVTFSGDIPVKQIHFGIPPGIPGGVFPDSSLTALSLKDTATSVTQNTSVTNNRLTMFTPAGTKTALTAVATRASLASVLSPIHGESYFVQETPSAGSFVWQAGDFSALVTADPYQGVYVQHGTIPSTQGAWVRSYAGAAKAEWFGLTPGLGLGLGPANVAILNSAHRLVDDLIIADGDYDVDNGQTSYFGPGVSTPRTIRGESWQTRLVGGDHEVIYISSPSNGLKISNLTIHSTGRGGNGQLVLYHVNVTDMTIDYVQFTNSGGLMGQNIKLVTDNATVGINNVTISRCTCNGGGMNIEVQNAGSQPTGASAAPGAATPYIYRYQNLKIVDCTLLAAGTIAGGDEGMGVSLTGPGMNCAVERNFISGFQFCGVEFIGPQASSITGNTFDNAGSNAPLINATNTTPMYGCVVSGNRTTNLTGLGLKIYSLFKSTIVANNLTMKSGVEIRGNTNVISNNTLVCPLTSNINLNAGSYNVLCNNYLECVSGATPVAIFGGGIQNSCFGNYLKNPTADITRSASWIGADYSLGNNTYGNYRDNGTQQIAEAWESWNSLAGSMALLNSLSNMQGTVRAKGYTGAAQFSIQCEVTDTAQPFMDIEVRWYSRENNAPAGGVVNFSFGSFDDPHAAPNVWQAGGTATITTSVTSAQKLLVVCALPVNAGFNMEITAHSTLGVEFASYSYMAA